jgi:hypothetical protein
MRQGKDEAVFISAPGRSSVLFKKAGTPGSRWNHSIEQSLGNRPAVQKNVTGLLTCFDLFRSIQTAPEIKSKLLKMHIPVN